MDLAALSRYRFAGKSEQAVREEWIRPLLVHLGYGIETLHEVRYEQHLKLAAPFRRLGSVRVRIDYRPTVLGHGLWIIEAKAPDAASDWDDAISQAWLYATHPEVDVPFMAIADGSRIAVYDVYEPDWDAPVVDITARQLEAEFAGLAGVLGAANVAKAIRTRRMRHLGLAMRAEVSHARLREYVKEVEQLAKDAASAVSENQRSIYHDERENRERDERELVADHGLVAVGAWANNPTGESFVPARLGAEYLRGVEPNRRIPELRRLIEASIRRSGQYGSDHLRMFWMLRLTALHIDLEFLDDSACGEYCRDRARQAVRDHLLSFPDDPLGRAAHRLERVLPLFAVRLARVPDSPDLHGIARQIQDHWSDEQRLRVVLDGDRLLRHFVDRSVRAVWNRTPWTVSGLTASASVLESMVAQHAEAKADANSVESLLEWHFRTDQLQMGTLHHFGPSIPTEFIDGEIADELRRLTADPDADRIRVAEPARALLARCP